LFILLYHITTLFVQDARAAAAALRSNDAFLFRVDLLPVVGIVNLCVMVAVNGLTGSDGRRSLLVRICFEVKITELQRIAGSDIVVIMLVLLVE
jgi:hypothetical protein